MNILKNTNERKKSDHQSIDLRGIQRAIKILYIILNFNDILKYYAKKFLFIIYHVSFRILCSLV